MLLSNQPTKVQVPFANSGTKNAIPIPSQIGVTPGAASFTDGFPPLTFTPLASGGVPPAGADFNGIFNAITQILRWACGGGHFTYDSAWSTANGGYPKGALLLKADGTGYWKNLVDGNTTNPDSGGSNWAEPFLGNTTGVSIPDSAGLMRFVFYGNGATLIRGWDSSTPVRIQNASGTDVAQFLNSGVLSLGADAVSSGDATRLGQVNSLISVAVNTRAGHTYTASDWAWIDKSRGLFAQWAPVSSSGTVTFNNAFTTACFLVLCVSTAGGGIYSTVHPVSGSITTSGFYWDSSNVSNASGLFLAIGV